MPEKISIRRAGPQDMRAVFELSNDPVVRANSIHTGPIAWETHVAWYTNAISDAKIKFFVVEANDGRIAGVLRLNNERSGWVVTIHVGEDFRNQSLGQWMLSEIVRQTRIRRFIAFVKPTNVPSKRLFIRMGYRNMGVEHRQVGAHQVALNRFVFTR